MHVLSVVLAALILAIFVATIVVGRCHALRRRIVIGKASCACAAGLSGGVGICHRFVGFACASRENGWAKSGKAGVERAPSDLSHGWLPPGSVQDERIQRDLAAHVCAGGVVDHRCERIVGDRSEELV